MKMKQNVRRTIIIFIVTFVIILAVFAVSLIKTKAYNSKRHNVLFDHSKLFTDEGKDKIPVSVTAAARSDTWTKVFDFNNEGLVDPNYQAYTYDFTVNNNTGDEVSEFSFKITFGTEAYLASGWNGSMEIHQNVSGEEITELVPDLRVYTAEGSKLYTFNAEERDLIRMNPGDYLIYTPSSSANALEMPIEPHEGTVPGCILYAKIGETIEDDSSIEIEYLFHRVLTNEPLFWIAVCGGALWIVAMIIFIVTYLQIRQYNFRHEHDNEIINESIETFIGFIDAKDPYTNGHSKRVALYTRKIAEEMGYDEETLDYIYYIGLLHDCGKIGIPDNILGKPGKLTDEEFAIIKTHTTRGGEILSKFNSIPKVGQGALYHHERYDGKGYPEGLAGEDIPLIARMICVADSFDAMNTNRVYRKRLTKEQIISELENNKGKQFDPKIAEIMLKMIRNNTITNIDDTISGRVSPFDE